MSTNDITIIGAGIIGLCSGLALQEEGYQVTLLDKAEPGQGASYGNAGIISPWSIVPQSLPGLWKKIPGWLLDPMGPVTVRPSYLPQMAYWGTRFLMNGRTNKVRQTASIMHTLVRDCIPSYQQLLAGTGAENLLQDAYYVQAYRNAKDANLNALDYHIRAEYGAELDYIDAQELHQLEPALSKDFKAAILIKGQARLTSPGRLGLVLANKFTQAGGLIKQSHVNAIQPTQGGWQYEAHGKLHKTSNLLLCAGAWSSDLLKTINIKVLMQNERGYHILFPNLDMQLNNSVMDADMKFVASQMEDGLRIAGTAEFDDKDAPLNEKRAKGLAQLSQRMFPDISQQQIQPWVGVRPSMPDSLPCIGSVKQHPGLYVAFGHSHYGMMMAPKTGQLISQHIAGKISSDSMHDFRLNRF
ncbi:MAG: FAD-binding oxidoreductase [Gammaproteobacteria bacterium]|nr:FAD-binding oxidoreductase [Gammaproteobacteria bacterium]